MKQTGRNPTILIFSGLILVLVPALLLLAYQYADSHRQPPPFVPTPDQGRLLELVQQKVSIKAGAVLKPVYTVAPDPVTGITAVYDIDHEGVPLYRMIVFRHDIACSTCRDVLAAGLYDIRADTLVQVLLLDPWEVRGEPVETRSFLEQFVGESAQTTFHLGRDVDGISGATFSSTGLVERLNEAATWITQHPMAGKVTSSTSLPK